MKIDKEISFNIMKNAKHCSIMSRTVSGHELADNVNCISNVWSSDCKINEASNQFSVESRIIKESAIFIYMCKINIILNWSWNRFAISKTNSRKKIRCILG